MSATACISVVCFNFNKILDAVLAFIASNIYDDAVPTLGPNTQSIPITVESAIIDANNYTNKVTLMLNWKWDFDMGGFNAGYIKMLNPAADVCVIRFTKKHDPPSNTQCAVINFTTNTITIDGVEKQILFNDVCLLVC
jgi:hypothetical protein